MEEEIDAIIAPHPYTPVYCMPLGGDKAHIEANCEAVIELCKRRGFIYSDRLHIRIWDQKQRRVKSYIPKIGLNIHEIGVCKAYKILRITKKLVKFSHFYPSEVGKKWEKLKKRQTIYTQRFNIYRQWLISCLF
jgi:hypothetical protein